MDFVDDFRYHKDPAAIAEPFEPDDEKLDAVFAGVIETLCDELGTSIPAWLERYSIMSGTILCIRCPKT